MGKSDNSATVGVNQHQQMAVMQHWRRQLLLNLEEEEAVDLAVIAKRKQTKLKMEASEVASQKETVENAENETNEAAGETSSKMPNPTSVCKPSEDTGARYNRLKLLDKVMQKSLEKFIDYARYRDFCVYGAELSRNDGESRVCSSPSLSLLLVVRTVNFTTFQNAYIAIFQLGAQYFVAVLERAFRSFTDR